LDCASPLYSFHAFSERETSIENPFGIGDACKQRIPLALFQYQLQFKTNLTQPNWTNASGPITATNTSATASDIIGPDRQRFYRVALMP
jgi:hypothetical protein